MLGLQGCATLSGLWGLGDGVWGFVHSWEVTYHESYVSSLEDLSLISKLQPIYSLIRETGELLLITQGVPRGRRGALAVFRALSPSPKTLTGALIYRVPSDRPVDIPAMHP